MIEASSDGERGKVKLVAMLPMRDPVQRYGTAPSSGAMRACGWFNRVFSDHATTASRVRR
jgi:hypothetical protein